MTESTRRSSSGSEETTAQQTPRSPFSCRAAIRKSRKETATVPCRRISRRCQVGSRTSDVRSTASWPDSLCGTIRHGASRRRASQRDVLDVRGARTSTDRFRRRRATRSRPRRRRRRLAATARRPRVGARPTHRRDQDGQPVLGRSDGYRVRLAAGRGSPTARGMRSGSVPRSMSTARSRRRVRTAVSRSRSSRRRTTRRRDVALPLPRAGLAMVGRHRLHLKHDEPLPVGGAHRQLVRRTRARRDDQRRPSSATSPTRGGATDSIRRGSRTPANRTRRSSTTSV